MRLRWIERRMLAVTAASAQIEVLYASHNHSTAIRAVILTDRCAEELLRLLVAGRFE